MNMLTINIFEGEVNGRGKNRGLASQIFAELARVILLNVVVPAKIFCAISVPLLPTNQH
jgi:hypothetical protein